MVQEARKSGGVYVNDGRCIIDQGAAQSVFISNKIDAVQKKKKRKKAF